MKRKTYSSSSQRKNTERHGRVVKSRKMLLRQIRHVIGSSSHQKQPVSKCSITSKQ
ncbi:hypothetical protein [Prevotella sp. TCVGH]|uniref:hypothetical protein n=1 Tax=Prevotella sp. TCVGH TaxID=2182433 RepID=UPI00201DA956|nr:hypothetical protein [Prevotella sp. TCVGH]